MVVFVESMRTKFEVPSFGRCRDIEKFAKFKNGSRDLDYVPCRPLNNYVIHIVVFTCSTAKKSV